MLDFFDCNVAIGRPKSPPPGVFFGCDAAALGGVSLDVRRLLDEMDRYGINEALIYHLLSKRHDAMRGNRLVAEAAAISPKLHPCWFVLPTATGEMPPLDELTSMMSDAGVHCLRMAPDVGTHQFSVTGAVCGELFEWLVMRRIPLMVELAGVSWQDIDFITENFPEIPLILLDITYRVNRDLYPRIKSGANLYVETSGFQQHCGFQDFCEKFGPDRLLFGSRLPFFCAGPARFAVESAAIPDEAKKKIAGANMRRLAGRSASSDRGSGPDH